MRARQVWSREAIIKALRRHAKTGPLWFRHLKRNHNQLVRAAERLFGRWSLALKAAGIPMYWKGNNPGPATYTVESVRQILKAAWATGDVRIDPLRAKHAGIYKAAKRFHKTWQNALEDAGVPPGERRRKGQRPS